jgi:hypothetical protein
MDEAQSEFLSPEHLLDMATASLAVSGAFFLMLGVVHVIFYWLLPKDVRAHQVFLGPAILVSLAIFSHGLLPFGLLLITDNPMNYMMSGWGLAMFPPLCAITYPIIWANSWLRFFATVDTLKSLSLKLAAGFSIFTVAPFLIGGIVDLCDIIKTRLF